MGGENFCKSWERPSRSKEETETRERISLVAKFGFQLTHCAPGQPPRLRSDARDESAGFPKRQLFRCVVRLARFVRKVLDEMNALANEHDRRAFRHTESDQRGPAGVNAKTECGSFHGSFSQVELAGSVSPHFFGCDALNSKEFMRICASSLSIASSFTSAGGRSLSMKSRARKL